MALIKKVQWGWVLLTSFVVLNLVGATIFLATAIFASSRAVMGEIPDQAQIAQFTEIFGRWAGPISNFVYTFAATAWLALRLRNVPRLHGLLVGLLVSVFGIVYEAATANPIVLDEWLASLATIGFGWLGGSWGQSIATNREAVYRTSQAIRGADHQGIVSAIGTHLADSQTVLVALGSLDAAAQVDFQAVWHTFPSETPSDTFTKLPESVMEADESVIVLKDSEMTPTARQHWRALGIRSALVLPLHPAGGKSDDVLLVASRRKDGFNRNSAQNFTTIGAQVALALENLRLVAQAHEAGILQERQRLAGEIHDVLAQGFTSIVTHLEVVDANLDNDKLQVKTNIRVHLDQARQTARDSLTASRQMVWALRPDLQEGILLSNAVSLLAKRWSAANGIPIVTTTSGDSQQTHPDIETTMLRVTRESLNNIEKHAGATAVNITLTYLDTLIVLDVQDNGNGFDPESAHSIQKMGGGFGLKSIREQVERLGGELTVESSPGKGTIIAVALPIKETVS
ncbi:MAG: GAF domain-containing sensor histidine kinase [Chloroflexi bacterium]|nr:GAF domain-containing sensor histidine kinase [Chloroflexota bacterium]